MATCQIPTEIWIRVISFLYNPIPPPLSEVPRTAIRQQDLANVARVSKLFQGIAEKLLYKHVITDRLWELCSEIDKSSKIAKLARIQILRLEYNDRDAGSTYKELMEGGVEGWRIYGMPNSDVRKIMTRREVDSLSGILDKLVHAGPAKIFPVLDAISISAIYARSPSVVYRGQDVANIGEESCQQIPISFDSFLARSTVKKVCWRSQSGPLTPVFKPFPSESYSFKSIIHCDPQISLPLRFGMPFVWLVETGLAPTDIRKGLLHNVREAIAFRARQFNHPGAIDLDIYDSVARGWSKPHVDIAYALPIIKSDAQERLDGVLLEGSGVKGPKADSIRYHLYLTPPTCTVCDTHGGGDENV